MSPLCQYTGRPFSSQSLATAWMPGRAACELNHCTLKPVSKLAWRCLKPMSHKGSSDCNGTSQRMNIVSGFPRPMSHESRFDACHSGCRMPWREGLTMKYDSWPLDTLTVTLTVRISLCFIVFLQEGSGLSPVTTEAGTQSWHKILNPQNGWCGTENHHFSGYSLFEPYHKHVDLAAPSHNSN